MKQAREYKRNQRESVRQQPFAERSPADEIEQGWIQRQCCDQAGTVDPKRRGRAGMKQNVEADRGRENEGKEDEDYDAVKKKRSTTGASTAMTSPLRCITR